MLAIPRVAALFVSAIVLADSTVALALEPSSTKSVSPPAIEGRSTVATGSQQLYGERIALGEANVRSIDQLADPCTPTTEAATTQEEMPFAEALDRLTVEYAPSAACCRICTVGIACGNTCISARFICHVGVGCACNAGSTGGAGLGPVATPEYLRTPEISIASQSGYPRLTLGQTVELRLSTNWIHGPSWFDGDVEMFVANPDEAGRGLRGWDDRNVIAVNRGRSILSENQEFRLLVQGLTAGTHRLRVAFRHKTFGVFGPDGVYWDIRVDGSGAVQHVEPGWHSSWVAQSPYLVMQRGQVADFWIRFANTGTETWQRGVRNRQANLGLNFDDRSPFELGMASGWLSPDRLATTTAPSIAPGDVAEFRFSVRAPLSPGVYYLNLRPVIDGTVWMEDQGVFWVIIVP